MSDYHSTRFRNWKNKDKNTDNLRKDRSNTSIELRKKQRDEVLSKRRNMPAVGENALTENLEEENFDDLNNNVVSNNPEVGQGDSNNPAENNNTMSQEQAEAVAALSKAYRKGYEIQKFRFSSFDRKGSKNCVNVALVK